jgi:predicted ATP-grasp superfamily ATP-dependent carboligase
MDEVDALIPIGYKSAYWVTKRKPDLGKRCMIPTCDFLQFVKAGNKFLSNELAEKLGIPAPYTEMCASGAVRGLSDFFPHAVVKPVYESGSPTFIVPSTECFHSDEMYVAQEYIPGRNGYGFFALYEDGECISSYQHRRLRMDPPEGGASTYAELCHIPEIEEAGRKILGALNWHGPAMVEFKQHAETGEYYMLEVNPKYWGSLDLGISAGYEFPYWQLLYCYDNFKPYRPASPHPKKKRVWWAEYDLLRLRKSKTPARDLGRWFACLLDPFVVKPILDWRDPAPLYFYLRYALTHGRDARRWGCG